MRLSKRANYSLKFFKTNASVIKCSEQAAELLILIVLLAAMLENHFISLILAAEIFPAVSVGTLCFQELSALRQFPGFEVGRETGMSEWPMVQQYFC